MLTEKESDTNKPDALAALKEQADLMGLSYHPAIGAVKLRDKIQERLALDPVEEVAPVEIKPAIIPQAQKDKMLKDDARRLVRIRIACMNPNKKDWEGEIFTIGNSVVGTFRKYVPFDVDWHIPHMMLDMIETRQCQIFSTVTDPRTGTKTRQGKLVKEFSVVLLDDLTNKELSDLAQRQAMAAGTSEELQR